MSVMVTLVTTVNRIRPGLSLSPAAAMPSSRAHSSISLRLRHGKHRGP